jgi:hypothetical protein
MPRTSCAGRERLELYVGTIRYQGADRESVLLRALSPPAPTKSLQAELGDDIPF